MDRQREYYTAFHQKLETVDRERLGPEEQADFDIIQDQIALALLDIDLVQTWRHNPTYYVELLGNALFAPHVLEYAGKDERARHILSRLEKVPAFLGTAARNLFGAPEPWIEVALEENAGNLNLVDHVLREFMPESQRAAYEHAATAAILALKNFDDFLKDALPKRRDPQKKPDWRLGADIYNAKFRFALGTDLTPDQVLAAAEADVKRVRGEMYSIAKQLGAKGEERSAIRSALDQLAQKRSTPETYFDDARNDLAEAREFVSQKGLLTLPAGDNLQVVETPAFMRGIYSVGGFNPAPALEPKLGAFYWVTPIPKDWDPARADSKLREYNFYNLKLLTIHEAMPGHYVQGEFSNAVQPKTRRVLRGVFGNTPYVEGWAQYATQMMLDEGFLGHSPELRLTLLKQELRVLANAIIDIRLQTNRMTEQQALAFMRNDTFQELEEATGKSGAPSFPRPNCLLTWSAGAIGIACENNIAA